MARNPCHPKTCHELAISHIINATKHAGKGNHDEANYHIESALTFANMHHKKLKAQGRHSDANEYIGGINEHINRVKGMRKPPVKKTEDDCPYDHKKLKKGNGCNVCGYMTKSESLEKVGKPDMPGAFIGGTPQASMEKQRVGKPKQDPRYDYKQIHELHPHDQQLVQHKFGGKDISSYSYPIDRDTERLVHGTRTKLGETPHPTPGSYSYKELAPQHQPGTAVRITGHSHLDGKLGIVTAHHPVMGGKIGVQIGPSEHHKVYVEPHQVRLSRPQGKIEKALISLHNIRKVFMKSAEKTNEHGNVIGTEGATGVHIERSVHRGTNLIPRPRGGTMIVVPRHFHAPAAESMKFKSKKKAHSYINSLKIKTRKDIGEKALHKIKKRFTKTEEGEGGLPAIRRTTAPSTSQRGVAKDEIKFNVHHSDHTGVPKEKIGSFGINKEEFIQMPHVHEHMKNFLEQHGHITPRHIPTQNQWKTNDDKASKHLTFEREGRQHHFVAVGDKSTEQIQQKTMGWLQEILGPGRQREDVLRGDPRALEENPAMAAEYRVVDDDEK